ncbi:hypothetical protein CDV36_008247 [Fusarium kuroshium]|uniref:Uncharacterized protein n=2 Tax=Fusarium solani species complex TaxID=232080 RepID=A0A3M2S3I1_9HYPO|nr:hypothetical protein CDV36_008247 [Fusarium kuroshium]RSL97695.1 hypothetical protein CEP52_010764 [Fusarium oligoseptatum]
MQLQDADSDVLLSAMSLIVSTGKDCPAKGALDLELSSHFNESAPNKSRPTLPGYGLLDPTQSWGPPDQQQTARARHPWQVSSLPYDRLRELDRTGPSDPDNPVGPLPDETLRRRHHGDEDPPARIIGLVPVPMSVPAPLLVALQAPAPHGTEHGCPRIKELGWGLRTRKTTSLRLSQAIASWWWITMRSLPIHILGSYMFQTSFSSNNLERRYRFCEDLNAAMAGLALPGTLWPDMINMAFLPQRHAASKTESTTHTN